MKRLDAIAHALKAQSEAGAFSRRLDAGELAGFARLLEGVESTIYRVEFPAIPYRSLLPTAGGGFAEQEFHTYRSLDPAGEAKIITNHAADYPRVTVSGKEDKQPTRTIGASYEYTELQLRQAMRNGIALDTELAVLARESIERKADEITCVGSAADGIPAWATNAGLTAVIAGTKTGGGTLWSTYTGGAGGAQATEILGDVSGLVAGLRAATRNVFGPEAPIDLVFGDKHWNFLTTRYVSGANYPPHATFMEMVRRMGVRRVQYWPRLDTVGAGGAPRILAGIADARVAGLSMPQDIQVDAPQARNKAFVVNMDMRFSGVVLRHTKGWAFMDSTMPA